MLEVKFVWNMQKKSLDHFHQKIGFTSGQHPDGSGVQGHAKFNVMEEKKEKKTPCSIIK